MMIQSVRTLAVITTVPEASLPAEAALPEETAAVQEQEEEVIGREMIDTTVVAKKPAKRPKAARIITQSDVLQEQHNALVLKQENLRSQKRKLELEEKVRMAQAINVSPSIQWSFADSPTQK